MNAPGNVEQKHADLLIGAILAKSGRLKTEDTVRVLHLQREQGIRFGDAALQLGLVSAADVDFALARQFRYSRLNTGEPGVSEKLVAAFGASGPEIEARRALRSQLMMRWFAVDPSHRALAVVGSNREEGCSFLAASIGVAFSQLGKRTLLIDADMRRPGQHEIFSLDNRVGLSALLSGRAGHEAIQRIPALFDLSVLPAGAVPPNPAELLARPAFPQLLREAAEAFDVILLDTTATSECTDAYPVAQHAGAAVVVARRNRTRITSARTLVEALQQTGAVVVGAVFTDF